MHRVNPTRFTVATRRTSREINRAIALNLVRSRQPISRADLARAMGVRRGAVSLIVAELVRDGLVVEGATGATGATVRGRKPTFLYIDSRRRAIAAVDIRASQTFVMLTDKLARPLTEVVGMPTLRDPRRLARAITSRITRMIAEHPDVEACEGIGVVVPGMVEPSTMSVLHAPTLGWRDVNLRDPLAAATGVRVQIENSGRACALAQAWAMREDVASTPGDLVFVSVSDGVGVGVMIHGEVLRGRHNIAGEFGHVPLSLDGPRCSCGANGCWEAYISNRATLARYFGRPMEAAGKTRSGEPPFTIADLLARARARDSKAAGALQSTARYLGLGLASVVNALDPARVYIGGEITEVWDLIEPTVRIALAERSLTPAGAAVDIRPVAASEYPRLHGAAALVAADAFAAPIVA
jgi:predicted NBD/HSP70 family sugar kinase